MDDYCIYLRKSRKDAEAEARGEGETLARHMSILLELAEKQNLNIVKIYREIVSGESISARPQMQSMLANIADNRYAGVLVMEIERLARGDTIDQGIIAQAFRESGTKIITPVKTYNPNNEFDEEYFEFSLFMSRREYKTIRRRMQTGRLSAVKEGNYISPTAPYGYRKISPDSKIHTLEIVAEEAEIVKLIFRLYLDGHGTKYIANELNRMGIKPQKSHYWENPSIKKILGNPIYCGLVGWKTKSNGDTLYKGLHKPIVSKEIFDSVQFRKKNSPVPQTHADSSLLNYYHGIIYCKNCGHQMKRRTIADREYEHLYCTYRQCRGITVSASFQEINEVIMSAIFYRIKQMQADLSCQNEKSSNELVPDKRKLLESELARAEKQKSRLYDLLEQEVYDKDTFLERCAIANDKIRMLETALSEFDEETNEKLSPDKSVLKLQYIIDNFDDASPKEKNIMLKSVIRKICYSKSLRKQTSALNLEIDFL